MSIVGEIVDWANQQSEWVSDAVRRVFEKGELHDDDIEDLAALVKTMHGIADTNGRTAVPMNRAQVPTEKASDGPVSVLAIKAPKHINAITVQDGITFEAAGLTIVYGNNGAGKSGYARALKRACRARKAEDIYPDVFSSSKVSAPAQARFEWQVGQTTAADDWINDGRATPAPLSRIAVFDSHCARVFVDDQASVSYIPYGLDVLKECAAVMRRVQKHVEDEAAKNRADARKLDSLRTETTVGELIKTLKHSSLLHVFEQHATLTTEESEELLVLRKLLGDDDPAKAAVALRRAVGRLQLLENELTAVASPLTDEHINALELAFKQLVAAENASKLASQAVTDNGQALAGTGTEPWEVLMRSAMEFTTKSAYPGHEFPPAVEDAKCVLCQQPLSLEATERLRRFVTFLDTEAQKLYTEKRLETAAFYKAITRVDIDGFLADTVRLDELKEEYPAIELSLREFVAALQRRKNDIIAAAPQRTVGELFGLPESPVPALQRLIEGKTRHATQLEGALTPEARQLKVRRLRELEARVKLGEMLHLVSDSINELKREHAFAEASRACSTTSLTRKINELYDRVVTTELEDALMRECSELGINPELIGLEMSGQRGTRMQKLKLAASAQFSRVKPSGVLSEGEQRAIALASFLAEISLEQDGSGIVFDDPVSSVDHVRREKIALRLVKESKSRQVVVFSHDLAFAWSLRDLAKRNGAPHSERFVFSNQTSKGNIAPNFPFEAKRLDARVNDLKALAARARKQLEKENDYEAYNDLVRQGYRKMRDTWELVVEDLLFNEAVKRFRRSVETQRLASVHVSDDEVQAVSRGMTRCSYFTHEGGAEAPPPLPQPDEFEADLQMLESTVTRLKAQQGEVEKRRKKEGLLG
ncbi:AAA family ATPase [Massilia phyllosphaerae]|uniref:AAA family ATPase n=1 Tax=Massilia phyllosphaerae TaxID=3106034 RepID=UPI002B1CBF0D|nr:AAA family ATPase [Massilia sp. SGZ-792]